MYTTRLVFSLDPNSPHTVILKNICNKLVCKKSKNNDSYIVHQNKVTTLHLDEIGIHSVNSFSNKKNLFGPAHNDPEQLVTSMQVSLLTTITGKKKYLNLASIPVYNMEAIFLK